MTDTSTSQHSVLIDVHAVATMLSCSTRHVYRLCDGGRMPQPVRLGALIRWDRSVIEAHAHSTSAGLCDVTDMLRCLIEQRGADQ